MLITPVQVYKSTVAAVALHPYKLQQDGCSDYIPNYKFIEIVGRRFDSDCMGKRYGIGTRKFTIRTGSCLIQIRHNLLKMLLP